MFPNHERKFPENRWYDVRTNYCDGGITQQTRGVAPILI